MKNIFKSSKNRKSFIGAALAAISLFSFNFSPISIISNKIVSAAKYEATETKITENTSSTQISATELVSNLKDYFLDSNAELELSKYYEKEFKSLLFAKIDEMLTSSFANLNPSVDYKGRYLNSYDSLEAYFGSTSNQDYLDFIFAFISQTEFPIYSEYKEDSIKKLNFYNDLAVSLGASKSSTADDAYDSVKSKIDAIIKKSIAIESYDGTDGNKVAAIIANKAPSKNPYTYGTSYEKITTPFKEYLSDEKMLDTSAPFLFQNNNGIWKQFENIPYVTNTNGSLVVYAISDGTASRSATCDYLGYKTISLEEVRSSNGQTNPKYFEVPYTSANESYYRFLYNQAVANKINENLGISYEDFINIFYTDITGETESTLLVKYSDSTYKYSIYVSDEDYEKFSDSTHKAYNYKYKSLIQKINSNIEDYVKISSTTTSTATSYGANDVGDVTLYFKNEINYYEKETITYLSEYETEVKLDLAFEETNGKKNIYVLDKSENADENKIYQSLGYTPISAATHEYLAIAEGDDNYNKNFELYYKYADSSKVFAKNLLLDDKNAIYILNDDNTTETTAASKLNGYILLSKDELSSGYFTLLNKGDARYVENYKLYYRYNVSKNDDGTYTNAKIENKIYEYTSSKSTEYTGFYKTDSGYDIENYEKILKSDDNYKQGYDLYYKKLTTTDITRYDANTTYSYVSKNAITFKANSYYAISFYVNTTGSNVSASVEFVDENEILNDLSITEISTNGDWKQYYLFFATDYSTDSKAKLHLSMGSKDGIYDSAETIDITGSVLFDNVMIYKINETDYNKQTINNTEVYINNESGEKVDSIKNNNPVETVLCSFRYQNNEIISDWNNVFDFNTIDSSYVINDAERGGNLQNIDIDNLDGYDEVTEPWQYYISREVSGKNNSELLDAYRKAYKELDVSISLENEANEKAPNSENTDDDTNEDTETDTSTDNESSKEDDEKEDTKYDVLIDNTFNYENKILKIKNNNSSMSLGIVSKPFTLKASECYKISLWIYSADEKATATVKLISNLLTAQNNDYGTQLSAGSSDISAYLKSDDSKTTNEYRWLPVEFYIQGNMLADQKVNLVLLADENSTVYFDNIKIERILTEEYTDASSTTRVYKLSLANSSTGMSKLITNGFFETALITDLKEENYMPKQAQNWTITSDAAQDYVTAGIISSSNNTFITEYNDSQSISDIQATNMYAINIRKNDTIPAIANHKIYTSSSATLSASSVYKITFEYYYSSNNFEGDVIANLYSTSYKAENKISSIRTTVSSQNENADNWNQISFYVATGSASQKAMLELGVENASGTLFIRNVYATTISQTLNDIRKNLATDNGNGNLTIQNDKVQFVDYASNSFTINGEEKDGLTPTKEFETNSSNTANFTSGKSSVVVASFFTDNSEKERTISIDKTTYYIYDNEGTLELYKYPVYANTNIENNEIVENILGKTFVIEDNKVIVGTGIYQTEYDITENINSKFEYNFSEDITIGSTVISASELKNSQSNNVIILANSNETDYTEIEAVNKMSLSTSSYYALKFYVKTSDFENEDFGLSIDIVATDLDITWGNDLINTTNVDSTLNKDEYGFVCYQALIATNKSSYNDLVVTFSLGNIVNTGKGYAIISKVELTKIASEEEFEHYSSIFTNEEDDSIVKTYEASSNSSTSDTSSNTTSEVTWATFFYIFSSLLLFVTLVIAMIAVALKKHPIKRKKNAENENFDLDASNKTKEKINNDKETNIEGGIE